MNNRLIEIRNFFKLSQKDFAKKLCRGVRIVQYYESGEKKIESKFIDLLEEILNINKDWFLTGEGEMFNNPPPIIASEQNYLKKNEKNVRFISIPYHNHVAASAGHGVDIFDETTEESIEVSSNLLQIKPNHDVRCIRASGISMSPRINDGDYIFVDLTEKNLKDEGVYVLRFDSTLLIKHVQRQIDGLRLISENKDFQPVFIPAQEFESQRAAIIGKVVANFSKY